MKNCSDISHHPGNRYLFLDMARGIAILLVILGHVLQCLALYEYQYDENWAYLLIYSFHMPLFMFISGLLFSRSIEKYSLVDLIKKKSLQLLYPYVLWSFFVIGGNYVSMFLRDKNTKIVDVIHTTSLYWFLISLWLSCIIVAVLYKLTYRFYSKLFYIAICILAVVWFLVGVRDRNAWMYIFFSLGIILSQHILDSNGNSKKKKDLYALYVSLAVILTMFILLNYGISAESIRYKTGYSLLLNKTGICDLLLYFLRAILGIVVIIYICKLAEKRTRKVCFVLENIGKFSLEMYLIQKLLVEEMLRYIVNKYSNDYPTVLLDPVCYSMVCFVVFCMSGILVYKISYLLNCSDTMALLLFGKHHTRYSLKK